MKKLYFKWIWNWWWMEQLPIFISDDDDIWGYDLHRNHYDTYNTIITQNFCSNKYKRYKGYEEEEYDE